MGGQNFANAGYLLELLGNFLCEACLAEHVHVRASIYGIEDW